MDSNEQKQDKDQPQFSAVMEGITWQYTTHPAIRYAHADRPGGVLTHVGHAGERIYWLVMSICI
ncbi:MAG: hypothetical protein B7Y07_01830 [Halothiobacillus sp. 24-54-40]|nr:MAG: hypothetical protein B7X12_03690 [Halothiobacillus sp. 20-53-49]OYZ88073.1 MAG: hypothetical protein B7Y07_01830 [Halothiobacillus sp. 24-54-40]OZA81540.1 MAG: hypothetical protein B7X64_00885 [Halothiobacillus sp. 39-53-45]